MKSNRPVNLPLSQVLSVNNSPIARASILHRISGIILFVTIPIMLWIVQQSLTSPSHFAEIWSNMFLRFVVWVFVASIAFHFVMGIKHLLADAGMNEELKSGTMASIVSFVIAAILIVAAFIWVMF